MATNTNPRLRQITTRLITSSQITPSLMTSNPGPTAGTTPFVVTSTKKDPNLINITQSVKNLNPLCYDQRLRESKSRVLPLHYRFWKHKGLNLGYDTQNVVCYHYTMFPIFISSCA